VRAHRGSIAADAIDISPARPSGSIARSFPVRNFESLRRHIQTAGYNATAHGEDVICIELSLEKGTRHQSIFLSELDDDDGRPYLRVSTAIAPTTGMDPKRALGFNWQSVVGYLAIGNLDGVPYLQLVENRPYEGLEGAEVDRLVLEIGGLGDRMERMMSAGGDLL